MLYEDQRRSSDDRARVAPAGDEKLNLRGATAFDWKKDFIYDDSTRRATMSGEVDVVHRGGEGSADYRMRAERLIAELMPADSASGRSQEAKLKNLLAEGGVTFNSASLQFIADRVDYDPQRQVLTARGTDRAPATLLDKDGIAQGTFVELIYDVRADRMQLTHPSGTIRRTGAGGVLTDSK
jgi:hypothetical protein